MAGAYPIAAHRDRVLERAAVRKTIEVEAAVGYELRGFIPPPIR